jgi:hypothetical protein
MHICGAQALVYGAGSFNGSHLVNRPFGENAAGARMEARAISWPKQFAGVFGHE